MARGHEVEPERVRAIQERGKLDVLVAPDARVGRSTCSMLGEEVGQHGALEFVVHVNDLEIEPDQFGHGPGVRLGPRPAASVVDPAEVHQLHVRTEDPVPLLVEDRGGHRGVDPAAHGDQDRRTPRGRVHAVEATSGSLAIE